MSKMRMNLTISKELNDKIIAESESLGITRNSYVVFAVAHYIDQQQQARDTLKGLSDKLADLEKNQK